MSSPTIHPELQAAADRLLHAGGYLRYLVAAMRPNEHDRHCRTTDLTVRQTFAHLAGWIEAEAAGIEACLRGEQDFEQLLADTDDGGSTIVPAAAAAESAVVPELLQRYNRAYVRILAAFRAMPPEMATLSIGEATVAALLLGRSTHAQSHAVDFAEALPRLRFDPLLLDWALSPVAPGAGLSDRQTKLLDAASAYVKSRREGHDS